MHVRCTTFYSVKISVARAIVTTSIDRGKTLVLGFRSHNTLLFLKCPIWDVKEPTHYSKRVVAVQLGVTYMYEYSREIKLAQTRSM